MFYCEYSERRNVFIELQNYQMYDQPLGSIEKILKKRRKNKDLSMLQESTFYSSLDITKHLLIAVLKGLYEVYVQK